MNSNGHASLKAMWRYSHSWFRWSLSNANFVWMAIYSAEVRVRPSVVQIMMINSPILGSPWIPEHNRPVSIISVKSWLWISSTLPRVGNWTMDWSNGDYFHIDGQAVCERSFASVFSFCNSLDQFGWVIQRAFLLLYCFNCLNYLCRSLISAPISVIFASMSPNCVSLDSSTIASMASCMNGICKALWKSMANVDCRLLDAFGGKERGWYYKVIEFSFAGPVINRSCEGGLGYWGKEYGGTREADWWVASATIDCMLEVPINDAIIATHSSALRVRLSVWYFGLCGLGEGFLHFPIFLYWY